MFGLDAFHLARIQFAFTVSFHIIFPAITIGLASYLAVLEGLWLKTKNPVWRSLWAFWSKIFAVNFGMGVVSGLVMAYQFGTNWSGFSQFAGSITGPLLTYEVLTAFFLEAGFLGVMLFGWNKVGPGLHFFATCMVALGTLMSTFWILASNSWMQTPQGFEIVNGQVVPVDWFAVVFNPSFPYRLLHMTIAAFLSSALFVGASAAWHLLKGNNTPAIRTMFSMALWMTLIVAPIQALVGDMHGLNTLQHQPAKIAAIEGHWENTPGEPTPLLLLGGLSLWLRKSERLYTSKPFLRFALWMGPSGLIAILAGWVTTEVGRQPWVVYGLQRTKDAVSAHGDLHMSVSLLAFFIVYSSVFGVGYSYMIRLIRKGPKTWEPDAHGTAARPLSAAIDGYQHKETR
ncbi:cytochrome ubiquinol oxidase subunit I [Scandinavium goeteborgense]|uniref:cytochrome ubiquinol oxidase subunit I n=1 Tax=Scandinavium goeteborgense TaxID=1851514 RepID=UPI000F67413C|nr:cytochrome ubiquinol oxidase subunit I [Scandinavium goeteborgense]QKN81986.1 cytochrome ubiquinol oxidase subunit I [Scandinavium goeteborgense]